MECRIRVRGHLDLAWGDRLAGLRVAHMVLLHIVAAAVITGMLTGLARPQGG